MFYSFILNIPYGTEKKSPAEVIMPLTVGIIKAVYVQFPVGTRALTHVIIEHEGHQYLPTNPEGNISADGWTVPIENENFELNLRQCSLKAKGWSEADTYNYDINIYVSVENLPEIKPSSVISGLSKFLQLVGIKG